jgi:alpha-mannosidase
VGTSAGGRITSVRKTSYGQILTYQTSGPHAPTISTDVILFDREKKIEFINRVQKEPVENKEAVYFAFPLAIASPRFSYEIQNGWVDPSRDVLKGGSVEWSTVQHWVKEEGADVAVGLAPIDAPLVTLGDIDRGTWPEKFMPKSSVIFSWVMNNYWHTDFRRVQTGNYTFRYALTSGRELTPESLDRMGRAAMTPLEWQQVLKTDKYGDPERPLSPAATSFLQVDAPNVAVENWKTAEDGHGTIVRLVEVGGKSADVHLSFPEFDLQQAWRANAVEENQEELPVSAHSLEVKIHPHEILTLRVTATFAKRLWIKG